MSVNCKHWTDCGIAGGGCCSKGYFGGRPSLGVCRRCPNWVPTWGLGSLVKLFTKWTGVASLVERRSKKTGKPCGCQKREDRLNQVVPLRRRVKNG